MTPPPPGLPNPNAWLWWTALLLVVAGSAVFLLIKVFASGAGAEDVPLARLVLAIFLSLAGVCIISATAGWWIRR